jgi:uncharacterized caspase-like protein
MLSSSEDLSHRRKLALIIGNGNYSQPVNKLSESAKNANNLGNLLKKIKFDVTIHTDVSQEDEMMEKVKNFVGTIKTGALVFFYFSGHGCQVEKENFLIPVHDERIDDSENVKELATNFQRILKRLINKKRQCRTIIILDCCRPYVLSDASTITCK